MKTVTTIHLNGKAYQFEDDAHQALAAYLTRAGAALADNPDKDEILADFEQAIAEKCDRYITTSKNVILHKEIETIIGEMGPVEGGTTSHAEPNDSAKNTDKPKRLYRDMDNRVVAGVASGLAQYFGVDVAIVRIVFILSVLLGGSGVVIYIVLWLAVPEAESTAQKLEMRGSHVTLSNMTDMLKEKIDEVSDKNGTVWQKLASIPLKILRAIGQIIQKALVPAVRAILGSILTFAGFLGAVAATIAIGAILFAAPASVSDFGAITTMTGHILYIALVAGYVVVLIPLLFIFFAGLGIMEKKNRVRGAVAASFLALWFLAIITAGVTGARSAFLAERSMNNDPSFQETSQMLSPAAFDTLVAANGQDITFVPGSPYSVELSGRTRDIEAVQVASENGTLTIEEKNNFNEGCFIFCFGRKNVHIIVTAPTLKDITLKNGSDLEGTITADTFTLDLKNASYANVSLTVRDARFSLENGSHLKAAGIVTALDLKLANASRYEGSMLSAQNITILAENGSHAGLGTSTTLNATGENGSRIEYMGTPTVQKKLKNGSVLEPLSNKETE